jgi:hypothetical protein
VWKAVNGKVESIQLFEGGEMKPRTCHRSFVPFTTFGLFFFFFHSLFSWLLRGTDGYFKQHAPKRYAPLPSVNFRCQSLPILAPPRMHGLCLSSPQFPRRDLGCFLVTFAFRVLPSRMYHH